MTNTPSGNLSSAALCERCVRSGAIRSACRVDADGKNLRRLTEGSRHVEFKLSAQDRHGSTDGPHISPDGQRIAYVAAKGGVTNVCVMNLDGTGQRQLTARKAACARVRWSPDGRQVAFVSFAGKYPRSFSITLGQRAKARSVVRQDRKSTRLNSSH